MYCKTDVLKLKVYSKNTIGCNYIIKYLDSKKKRQMCSTTAKELLHATCLSML